MTMRTELSQLAIRTFLRGPMRRSARILLVMLIAGTADASAQSVGTLAGRVSDAATSSALRGVEVRLDGGRRTAITDTSGEYRVRALSVGLHTVEVVWPGYRSARRSGIVVRPDEVTRVDILLAPVAVQLTDLRAVGVQDPVLDPLATASTQRIDEQDLRRLPISSLEDAIGLQAGVVGESYRGGRVGQQALLLDGFGIKNQLDASTGGTGIKIPPDLITEASLITNGFSARYGQALSGLINVVTRDGGDRWRGRLAYETDRPMGGASDLGLDRIVLQGDGPISNRVTAVGIVDVSARLDADPVNAPRPDNPLDPRTERPAPLPHNSGETWTAGGKLTVPVGDRFVGRVFGIGTTDQRYLYDQQYKYDPDFAPGSRTSGKLFTAHMQMLPGRGQGNAVLGDLRIGWFNREFVRGAVDRADYRFGAFTGKTLGVVGEEFARTQDTSAVRGPVDGFSQPQLSSRTPWGVPAFFLGGASQGEIAWNEFSELRTQLDLTFGLGRTTDIFVGGLLASQDVKTFQRVLAYRPVGGIVPPATASAFSPTISAAYVEAQTRGADLAIVAGVRYDAFDPGGDLGNATLGSRSSINPRVAVSTVLQGATVVASIGRFSQPPDLQFLVDAAFDDTTRTGRFRQGNPNLGFEQATQFELSARLRLRARSSLKFNVYFKNLDGLVATAPLGVNPDSSVFLNADIGTVTGAELIFERERHRGWGARLAAVIQKAEATVTDAFELQRLIQIDPASGDTLPPPARSQFPLDYDRRLAVIAAIDGELVPAAGPKVLGVRPFGGLTASGVFRFSSGLPYSRSDITGDSLTVEPNGSRLPSQMTIDALVRRPLRLGRFDGGIYLDVRNVLGHQNQVSVRRDTGNPFASEATIARLANDAYNANPDPIPYESPRYRRAADLDNNGLVAGRNELFPLYEAAARDFTQPLFVFGPPRLIRFGVEVVF